MATLVAIAYDDEGTAEAARQPVQRPEADLIIQADQVAAISRDAQALSEEDTAKLQEALQPAEPVAAG